MELHQYKVRKNPIESPTDRGSAEHVKIENLAEAVENNIFLTEYISNIVFGNNHHQ